MPDLFQKLSEECPLHEAAIDDISRKVQKQLLALKYEKKNINRIRLLVEDALLCWKKRFGDEAHCRFSIGKRFNKPYILLEVDGEQFNPLEKENETFGEWGQRLLEGLGFNPSFSYANGKNRIKFELKAPKPSSLLMMLFAVLFAAILGVLGNFMPDGIRAMLTTEVLGRVSDVFFGLLAAVSGPLVFLSVLTGICSIGDTATLGTMGKIAVLDCIAVTFWAALFSGISLPFVFGISLGEAGGSAAITQMADMLFGMIPHNMLSPFIDGNCLQIIVLSVAFGFAILIIGKRASGLVDIVEQLYSVISLIMSWIAAAIPFFVFVILLQNIWSGSFNVLLQAWKPFVLSVALVAFLFVLALLLTAFRQHIRAGVLLKAILPATMIALTTASSMAALSETLYCCESKFGVQKKFTNFALPISTMLCRPSTSIVFTIYVLYSMQALNMEMSVSSIVLMILSITLVLIAAPPVPGGILSCYAVVFAQLGIPASALAVVITLDIVMDFINSAVNTAIRQLTVLPQAKKLGIIDTAVLKNAEYPG